MMELGAWDWIAIGVVFLVLEVLVSGIFMFWIGLAAVTLAIILSLVSLSWKWQLFLFAVITLAYVLGWTYFGRSRFSSSAAEGDLNLNARSMNFIGQHRQLEEAIQGGKGLVIIDDSRWVVHGPDLPKGTLVEIISVKGSVLEVVPVKTAE